MPEPTRNGQILTLGILAAAMGGFAYWALRGPKSSYLDTWTDSLDGGLAGGFPPVDFDSQVTEVKLEPVKLPKTMDPLVEDPTYYKETG